MQTLRKASQLLIGCLAVSVLVAGAAVGAELAKWDQEKVTALAGQLNQDLDAVYKALRQEDAAQGDVGTGTAFHYREVRDRVRVARSESRHLVAELKDGKGYDDTVHAFERMMIMIRDARVSARRMFASAPLMDKITIARKTLDELADYYDPGAPEAGPPPVGSP